MNLVSRADSELLFQSSSQKPALVHGITFEGPEYLKLPILGYECRTLCFSLVYRHFVFSKDGKIFFSIHFGISKIRSPSNQTLREISNQDG